MSEYIKNILSRWIAYFSRSMEQQKCKEGFNAETAKIALLLELMKEQVPNENIGRSTR